MHDEDVAGSPLWNDADNSLPPIFTRVAEATDAAAVSRLCRQLGYASSVDAIATRLSAMHASDHHIVMVAVNPYAEVVGWTAAEERLILESGKRVEIAGLIVDQQVRRRGIGSLLIRSVQRWAAARSLPAMVVKSNSMRSESHDFFQAYGFELVKTQKVYHLCVSPR